MRRGRRRPRPRCALPRAWRRRFLGPAACSLLAGCVVGPNFRPPPAPTVTRYTRQEMPRSTVATPVAGGQAQRFVPGADVPGRWWELFGSPQIDALVERALRANPDLQTAQAALRVARENFLAQRGALYPQVTAGLTTSRNKNSAAVAPPLASNAEYYGLSTAQVSVSYTPDVFGAVRRQIENASALEDDQRYQLEAAYLTLTTNVVVAALQEASLRGQISATERSIAIDEEIVAGFERERRFGQAALGDVVTQQAALAQARVLLPPLQKQLAQQQDLLAALTGGVPSETPADSIRMEGLRLPTDLPLSLPSKLVEQRPDVRAAEANLHAASALIGVAKANRLPSFPLTAALGSQSPDIPGLLSTDNSFWTVAAGVSQPVFAGGSLLHRERGAIAAYDQAAAQYRSTVHVALQNVADTLQALDIDAKALRVSAQAQEAAARSLAIARQEFQMGELNSLAMLNAEQTNQLAVAALVQAQAARYSDTVALFQSLGGGWWNRGDVVAVGEK